MRMPRYKPQARPVVYHLVSRTTGGDFLFDEVCKEQMIRTLRVLARFCGFQVICFCMMDNHFHVLVRLPAPADTRVCDEELLHRLELLYGRKDMHALVARQCMRDQGQIATDLREKYLRRMGDVSQFMKEYKETVSLWFNHRTGRKGTLWMERFRCVVFDDDPEVLQALSAYINLNPVRAGLVEDPAEYHFCSYARAVAGDRFARAGLMSVMPEKKWRHAGPRYRRMLFIIGAETGQQGKVVMTPEKIREVLAAGGKLTLPEILRLKIRYLTDGFAMGSEAFVEEVFQCLKEHFGPNRNSGARKLRQIDFAGAMVMRDLKKNAVT